jgi:hypothetical protein
MAKHWVLHSGADLDRDILHVCRHFCDLGGTPCHLASLRRLIMAGSGRNKPYNHFLLRIRLLSIPCPHGISMFIHSFKFFHLNSVILILLG